MKKILKILFVIVGACVLILIAALAYLNFVYLPQKVNAQGPAYLEEKTRGRVQAESIRYIPLKGVELKALAVVSKDKEPIFTIDKLYLNVNLLPLLTRRELAFRLDLYLPAAKRPLSFKGLYRIKEQRLTMDFRIKNNLFHQGQVIYGEVSALFDREEESTIALNLTSTGLNIQGNFYIKDNDLRIEEFSGQILQSGFKFIGDVQDLAKPSLNIYGNFELNLADLKKLNPEYSDIPPAVNIEGGCLGEVYLSSSLGNPEVGLKMKGEQIKVKNSKIESLSLISKIEDKKVCLSKFYARLYDGEIHLQGNCSLASPDLPANINLNIFNLDMNKVIKDIADKDTPVHGRLFSLGRLKAPLKNPRAVEGKVWLSVSGSNILQLPLFKGIAKGLRLPQLNRNEFKEASGNFTIAREQIQTADFKVASNNVVIHFKGSMDFDGNLGFDVDPNFSPIFISAPSIGNILGIFVDSTGNFLGEIKLKGNIKKPRYSFKPFSKEKFFPRGIEEGFKKLFKFKKEEEKN